MSVKPAQSHTYIATWEGWAYLATVIDLDSRRVIGWALADHMRTELVTDALEAAFATRRPPPGAIFHSDRGSQPSTPAATTPRSPAPTVSCCRSAWPANAGTVMMLGCFSGRPDPCYDRPWCPCVDVSVGRVAHRIRLLVGRADGDLIGA
jgi:hypothetical protein